MRDLLTAGAGVGSLLLVWFLFTWIVCAPFVSMAAHARGRSSVLWMALALVLSPFLAGLMLLIIPDRLEIQQRRRAAAGKDGLRLCPECAEVVRQEAHRCRHCHSRIGSAAAIASGHASSHASNSSGTRTGSIAENPAVTANPNPGASTTSVGGEGVLGDRSEAGLRADQRHGPYGPGGARIEPQFDERSAWLPPPRP